MMLDVEISKYEKINSLFEKHKNWQLTDDHAIAEPLGQPESQLVNFLNIHAYFLVIPFRVQLDENGKYFFKSTWLQKVTKIYKLLPTKICG